MSILNLFRKDSKGKTTEAAKTAQHCAHAILLPRWDNVQDIGHDDKATGYACSGCGQRFSLEEAASLRARPSLSQ
ncbi:MAG: hypothetical protein HW403_67 [Dehalococcoidia bacterium]|nr:hypothetical protein [Dehalococcoidia bacterium]